MADTLRFRGLSTTEITTDTVVDREIVIDLETRELVFGALGALYRVSPGGGGGGGTGGAQLTVSDTPPLFPSEGDLWYDLDSVRTYVYVTGAWVDAAPALGGGGSMSGADIKLLYEAEADTNAFTDAEKSKLLNIDAAATDDQTGAEIKALYEAEADTNAFTDAEQTKLTGIETGATADQTGSEIKAAYEAEADTNAFTDAEKTKLAGISGSGSVWDESGSDIYYSSGNVGIGGVPSNAEFHLTSANNQTKFRFENTGTGGNSWYFQTSANTASNGQGAFSIFNGNTVSYSFQITADNKVGINNSDPQQELDVAGNFQLAGKIIAGDSLDHANITSILDTSTTLGVAGFRPINLVDTSALIKIARIHDTFGPGFDLQQWDSTVTTMLSRSVVSAEGGNLIFNNVTEGGNFKFLGFPTGGASNTAVATFTPDGRLGMGTETPEVNFHLEGEGANTSQILLRQYTDSNDGPDIRFQAFRGTAAAPSAPLTGDVLGKINAFSGPDKDTLTQYGGFGWTYDAGTTSGGSNFVAENTPVDGGTNREFLRSDSAGDIHLKPYTGKGLAVGLDGDSPKTMLHLGGTILAETINYSSNQNEAYLIAGTSGWTGATSDWNNYGVQHRFKSDSNGVERVTIDTTNGEMFSFDTVGKLTSSQCVTVVSTGESVAAPVGGPGTDTRTDVSLLIPGDTGIFGHDNGYIRSLLKFNVGAELEIGQSGTSLIGGINLLPGTNGTAKVNGSLIWHEGNDGSGSGLDADTLDGVQGASYLRSDASDTYSGGQLDIKSNSTSGHYIGVGVHFDGGWKHTNNNSYGYALRNDGSSTSIKVASEAGTTDGTATFIDYTFSGTSADITADGNTVWHAGNDGTGSGLDADTLDGVQGASYLRSDASDVYTGTLTGAGNISFSGTNIEIGNGSGSVAMTINDGYGNANLAFNHASGIPDQDGNSLRIETNVDSTTNAQFVFEGKSNVTADVATGLTQLFAMSEAGASCLGNTVWHAGNDGAGSGLDADTVDGIEGSNIVEANAGEDLYTDFDSYTDNGVYKLNNIDTLNFANRPTGSYAWGMLRVTQYFNANYVVQEWIPHNTGSYIRHRWNGTWTIWRKIWTDLNDDTLVTTDTAQTISGLKDFTGTITYDTLNGASVSTRDKLRVWSSSAYAIGMQSGFTFGGLSDYAMTFQMNDQSSRGFWWGDNGHTAAQGAMSLTTNGVLAVATSLKVGYGESNTSAPGNALDVSGAADVTGILTCGGVELSGGAIEAFNNTQGGSGYAPGAAANHRTKFGREGGQYFTHYGNSAGNIMCAVSSTSNPKTSFYLTNSSDGGATVDYQYTFAAGAFTAPGNITAFSDSRLKENIEVIPNALDKVSQIRGVTYDRIDNIDHRQTGVIAQEVEAVLPEVIEENEEGIKSVAYGNMVGLLIESIKELKEENEKLRKRLDDAGL